MADNEEWVTTKGVLTINKIPIELEMTVPAKPLKPHRMLPIFHQMANAFTDVGVEAVQAGGESISCKVGCGACCRQPVPIFSQAASASVWVTFDQGRRPGTEQGRRVESKP